MMRKVIAPILLSLSAMISAIGFSSASAQADATAAPPKSSTSASNNISIKTDGFYSAPGGPVTSKSANYTMTTDDFCVLVSTLSATVTITLPDATVVPKRMFVVKKVADAGISSIVVNTQGGQTIEGGASITWINTMSTRLFYSDGSNWWVAAGF